jgi:NSS family neurotransmitter:Na+ symporter
MCALVCWLVGVATVLSFNAWATWFPLSFLPGFSTATVFDILDRLTSNFLLPISGLALAVFGGWIVPDRFLTSELDLGPRTIKLLRAVLKYIAASAILAAGLAPLLLGKPVS